MVVAQPPLYPWFHRSYLLLTGLETQAKQPPEQTEGDTVVVAIGFWKAGDARFATVRRKRVVHRITRCQAWVLPGMRTAVREFGGSRCGGWVFRTGYGVLYQLGSRPSRFTMLLRRHQSHEPLSHPRAPPPPL